MERLLVVDDDEELCALLEEYLGQEGFEVDSVHDGEQGERQAVAGSYAAVILDIMLPGRNGLDVLRSIRASSTVPVIMLTARGEAVDRIVGLEIGADDYLAKPFNPRELTARVRAVLRRVVRGGSGQGGGGARILAVGDLSLDLGARTADRAGEPIRLTGIEFEVLEVLVRAAGSVVTRDELSRSALGRRASALDRSLDVHVSNLRRKLGPLPGGSQRIKTVRGVGYQYVSPASGPSTG